MKKTTVYLEPDVDLALARIAEQEGVSKAEVIRRSLKQTAANAKRPRLSVGVFEGPGDVSENLDEYLARAIHEDFRRSR